jgi:Ca2+-binding EF-hand superfamily protein
MKRQDISLNPDFEPSKAFAKIDSDKDGVIDANDLVQFMKQKYVKTNPREAEMIIREYDADQDGSLSLEEFCQIILPATNESMRKLALSRNHSKYNYRIRGDGQFEVENSICLLLENELRFVKRREEIKKELLKRDDFIKSKIFQEMSHGEEHIKLDDLIAFLEKNAFYPKREDLEAILRRCNHDGNLMLSLEEFCEITSVNEYNLTAEESQILHSSSKKDLEKDLSASPIRKSNSREDILHDSIDEAMEKYDTPHKGTDHINAKDR